MSSPDLSKYIDTLSERSALVSGEGPSQLNPGIKMGLGPTDKRVGRHKMLRLLSGLEKVVQAYSPSFNAVLYVHSD
mgnify:CR=1 FL=1